MIKVKETEAKVSVAKRNITVTNVSINEDGFLVDEDGNIATGIAENLPEGVDSFDIKITIELPEPDDEAFVDDDGNIVYED